MRRVDHDRIVHEKDRTIARLEQQNRDLLDRLMFAVDKTWTPAPVRDADMTPYPEPDNGRFVLSPEQLPEDDLVNWPPEEG